MNWTELAQYSIMYTSVNSNDDLRTLLREKLLVLY